MNYNPYIYIIDYQSNFINYLPPIPASYPFKMKYLFVMEVLEQPGSGTRVHNVMVIRGLRHPNMDKQRKILANVDVTPPEMQSRSHDASMFCIQKCKKLEMLVLSKATTLRVLILGCTVNPVLSGHTHK